MKFLNLPKKPRFTHSNSDIPKLEMPQHLQTQTLPNPTRKNSFKRKAVLGAGAVFILTTLFFSLLYVISTWYDNHQVVFQQPIFVKVQTPVYIQQRFALSPIPHAEYLDVNPLTNPADIDNIIKNHGTFNPIETAQIDPVSKQTIETLVHNKVVQRFGEAAWPQVKYIIDHESGFDPYIVNKNSGACGLAQALPCSKLPSLDITDQIYWLVNVYIPGHWHTVQAAYNHKVAYGWY